MLAMMTSPVYRPMVRKDLPQLLSMSRENMAHIIFTSWGVEWRDEDLLHILVDPACVTVVREIDGSIVAYYSVEMSMDILFINSIQVKRGYQGLGLGGDMIRSIEQMACEEKASTIELWVQITNRTAMKFYKHMGYRMISRQGSNYLMRKGA